ncbi:MAG: exonuclease domain-containing protein [Burkholderiaceae bacterium]|nr:exonuclease domain-containing protein [Burkholderiaceae bacterium]
MTPQTRRAIGALGFALAPALVLAAWTIGAGAFFAWTLDPDERALLMRWLAPRAAMLLFLGLLLALALGLVARAAWERRIAAPARLAERAQALLAGAAEGEIEPDGSAQNRALASAFNALVRQRGEMRADIERRVRDASREIERQRSRLAALMTELAQSVVVCNLDGRILLYNHRALEQFRGRSDAPAPHGGSALIGLGRSIHEVFDPALIAHALQTIRLRMQRGDEHPSAQFLTTARGGMLLRAHMVPVRDADDTQSASSESSTTKFGGYLLMLEDVTEPFADASLRDRTMHELIEGTRASLGNLQAAVEMIDYPDVDDATRERLRAVIRDEVHRMGARLHDAAARDVQAQKTRWPLEDMAGADLLAAVRERIESSLHCRVDADAVDAALWLKVDSFSLLQALVHLAARLVDEYAVRVLRLRLAPAGARAHLDLVWQGLALSTETVTAWETDSMRSGPLSSSLTVRDVLERHDGEIWYQRDRARHESLFRLLLPIPDASTAHAQREPGAGARGAADSARPAASSDARGPQESRPEYYDFDLFRDAGPTRALADRALAELTCTVFDTETTGLDPSRGDRIVQIGAARIVAGKLRRNECFERLVDPQRAVSAASVAIHGLDAAMLAGQPSIAQVLPLFHAFARDSVLVGHNAAFDMRFLREAEAEAGVVFDQPVLDTLLLSAHVHPQQPSHSLEALAARLGVALSGRHSALGDALVTAEIFLKLVPLLEARGVRTLQQALDAAQQTWHARLRY